MKIMAAIIGLAVYALIGWFTWWLMLREMRRYVKERGKEHR